MKKRKKIQYQGYLYILPWIIGFTLLQLLPLINSFYYSLTNIKLAGNADFIGLSNYVRMFTIGSQSV